MRNRYLFLVLLLAAVTLAFAPPVRAADSVATTQFRAAKKLYDQGSYQDAMSMFQLAWEQSHSPNARLYVGRCFIKLENYEAAYDELKGTLRDASDKMAEDPKYQSTRNAAAAELLLLEPKIAKLIITLDESVPDATVTIDGKPFPKIRIGDVVTMAPGAKKIVASAEGRDDVVRNVGLTGGRTTAVALHFASVVIEQPPPPVGPVQASTELSMLQWIGVGAIGLSGVALIGTAALGAAASSKFGSLKQVCGDGACNDPAFQDVIDRGKTYEVLAYVSLGIGVAAGGAGVALLLFGGDEADDAGGDSATLSPLPGGAFFSYRGSF
jgi:hypothetical protein